MLFCYRIEVEMIKLLVSDFDGTLLPYGEKELSYETRNMLKALRASGITLAVSSGRTYGELYPHFADISDGLYFICCDGAYTVLNGKVIYQRKIDNDSLAFLFGMASEGFSMVLHGAFENYGFGDLPRDAERYGCIPVKGIYGVYGDRSIFKVSAYGKEIRLPQYTGLRAHWDGGKYNCTQIVGRYCDKGTTLSDLQMRLMLTKFDTACIGDSGNDVAMMRGAKYAFCVGERCSELSAVCTRTAANVCEVFSEIFKINGLNY